MSPSNRKRIIFVVAEDWYFLSHRLPMARAAKAVGLEVLVATKGTGVERAIRDEGFRLVPIDIDRTGLNPIADLRIEGFLTALYRTETPAIVHHVAMKPVVYGTRAAKRAGVPATVNTLGGFGFLFVSDNPKARLLRPLVAMGLRKAFHAPGARLVLQNEEARDFAVDRGLARPETITLIRGSGVDVLRFRPTPEPDGPLACGFVARMLRSKGVEDVIAAARILKSEGRDIRFVMVGDADPANPDSLTDDRMRSWAEEGLIDWRGRLSDVAPIWAECHVALLPSRGEGLPKSLLEAMSCGRPAITSNHTGCAELVRDGLDGILIPDKNAEALAEAIRTLEEDPALRKSMGLSARSRIEKDFSDAVVGDRTKALYRACLEETA